jgi:hypothetical protein
MSTPGDAVNKVVDDFFRGRQLRLHRQPPHQLFVLTVSDDLRPDLLDQRRDLFVHQILEPML